MRVSGIWGEYKEKKNGIDDIDQDKEEKYKDKNKDNDKEKAE